MCLNRYSHLNSEHGDFISTVVRWLVCHVVLNEDLIQTCPFPYTQVDLLNNSSFSSLTYGTHYINYQAQCKMKMQDSLLKTS